MYENNSMSKFILDLNKDAIIHPVSLGKKYGLDVQKSYKLCETLLEQGFLTLLLEAHCPHCNQWTGKLYQTFMELSESLDCPHCGKRISDLLAENTYVVYKRI